MWLTSPFSRQKRYFADRYRFVAPDLRGNGRSEKVLQGHALADKSLTRCWSGHRGSDRLSEPADRGDLLRQLVDVDAIVDPTHVQPQRMAEGHRRRSGQRQPPAGDLRPARPATVGEPVQIDPVVGATHEQVVVAPEVDRLRSITGRPRFPGGRGMKDS